MKKKIFYWSPYLVNVGTVKSSLNSAIALLKYSKSTREVSLVNVCGEWDNYKEEIIKNNINLIKLNFSYFKYLPKHGFLKSRLSYMVIFIFSFFPLIKLLYRQKPDYVIVHLITSLPLLINYLLRPKINFILRISGFPKLNLIRKLFWKLTTDKIYKITCPSIELLKNLKNKNFLKEEKFLFLPDAIINVKKFAKLKNQKIKQKTERNYILSVGRLTRQKNFKYLINEISEFFKKNENFDLYIIGDGEQKKDLKNLINIKKLNNTSYRIYQ